MGTGLPEICESHINLVEEGRGMRQIASRLASRHGKNGISLDDLWDIRLLRKRHRSLHPLVVSLQVVAPDLKPGSANEALQAEGRCIMCGVP